MNFIWHILDTFYLSVFKRSDLLLSFERKYFINRMLYSVILVCVLMIVGTAFGQDKYHQVNVKISTVDDNWFDDKGNPKPEVLERVKKMIGDANAILAAEHIKLVWDEKTITKLSETGTDDNNISVDTSTRPDEDDNLKKSAKTNDANSFHIIFAKGIDSDTDSSAEEFDGNTNGVTTNGKSHTALSDGADGETVAHEFLHSVGLHDDDTKTDELKCGDRSKRTGTKVSHEDDLIKQQNVTKLEGYKEVDKDGKVIEKNVGTFGSDPKNDVKDKETQIPTSSQHRLDIKENHYQYMGPWNPPSRYGSSYGMGIGIYGSPRYPEKMLTYSILINSDNNVDTGGTFYNLRGAEYLAWIHFFSSGNISAMLKKFDAGNWVYVSDLAYETWANYKSREVATGGSMESYVGDEVWLYIPIELIEANGPTISVATVSEDDTYYDETSYAEVFYPCCDRIAFTSNRDGNNEIYVMDANGLNQTRLTNNPAGDYVPSWSPDGSRIAFTSNRDGNPEVYMMNADGLNQTRLTNNSASDDDPAWSPDGSRIAFTSYRNGNAEVYVMDANGLNQTRLTNNPTVDYDPAWSPDGSRIAFTSNRDGNNDIYVMDADGLNQTPLTNNPAGDYVPAWSPDGSRIAFTSNRDGNPEVYVMDADGLNQTPLTNNPAIDYDPAWSPDGARISFTSYRDGNAEVYVMNADGLDQTRLTNNPAVDSDPVWIIVFCGDSTTQPYLGEECDDGNANSGDGCSATCQLEVIVTDPNGGNVIASGSTYTIKWLALPAVKKFDLKYSMNNGGTWTTIANKVTGSSYNWTVPKPTANKPNCLVKVIGYDASDTFVDDDISNAKFKIEVVKVTSPNGGENWKVGSSHAITWTTNGTKKPVAKVKLFYTTGGGIWNLIRTVIGNPGTSNWKVPAAASANCKVKVVLKDALGKTMGSDVSDAVFSIGP